MITPVAVPHQDQCDRCAFCDMICDCLDFERMAPRQDLTLSSADTGAITSQPVTYVHCSAFKPLR